MNGVAIAILVLGVAAGAAVQTSGVGGPAAMAGALLVAFVAAVYLVYAERPRSPVKPLRAFLARRRAMAPPGGGPESREHDLDTLQGFRTLHAGSVENFVRVLLARGIVGPLEARRLTKDPRSVRDLELLVERLAACEAQLR